LKFFPIMVTILFCLNETLDTKQHFLKNNATYSIVLAVDVQKEKEKQNEYIVGHGGVIYFFFLSSFCAKMAMIRLNTAMKSMKRSTQCQI
ncbi:hypothetical protein, partial [Salmonella sp. s54925]|uniref:hypothetical protein n=1 Tax=Salmonella sp. s54925 TaxID=3159674 RepID=UPI00397EF016